MSLTLDTEREPDWRYAFCREFYLGIKTLQTIAGLKRQLLEHLSAAGFTRPGLRARAVEALGKRNGGTDGVALAVERGLDSRQPPQARGKSKSQKAGKPRNHSDDDEEQEEGEEEAARALMSFKREQEMREKLSKRAPLLKALLCAALFPQVITVEGGGKSNDKGNIAKGAGGKGGGDVKFRAREEDTSDSGGGEAVEVALHPSCVASKEPPGKLESLYLVYHERVETSRVFVRDATPVPPYSLILFGGGLAAEKNAKAHHGRDEVVLSLDGWIRFECPRRIQSLVVNLRLELDKILKRKIEEPDLEFTTAAKGVLSAVAALMEEECH